MDNALIIALIGGLCGGSAVAALINQIFETKREKARRKDGESENMREVKAALKWVIYDRIRHLGQTFIADGEVSFDDRRILNEMHNCYHNGLGGNGDLDNLMREVNDLPLAQ